MPRGGCVLHSDGMVETGHEATTPQRTGGQRQRSGARSTSQCVAASDEPVGSLMVETDAASGATHMAHGWGEQRVRKPSAPWGDACSTRFGSQERP